MPVPLCKKCGFNNPPGMRYCGNCGSRLEGVTGPLLAQAPGVTANPTHQVGVMMGADLLERFRQAGLEAAGQRRTVTILFVDLTGFTSFSQSFDNEETYVLIQQYLSLMAKNVYKYDGMVDKFMGDGLMAIFGAPIAHENSAELALRSALDMHADMADFSRQAQERIGRDLRLHIGLHTGPVVVGSLGSSMMMNYTAIGDTVNLAFRLEQHCPAGSILVSESTYQQTRALFDFTPVAPLSLKGIEQPVPAYRVLGPRATPGSLRGLDGLHAPLIGRHEEIGRLEQAAGVVRQEGRTSLVWVEGDAGIGKSRLLREFTAALSQADFHTLVGHSYTYRRSVPYWIFVDLLRTELGVPVDAGEGRLRQALETATAALFGAHAEDLLPYLEVLFSLKVSSPLAEERLAYLDAAQLRQQVFLAVREWLAALARRKPLLVLLEDLHWADDTSLDLLSFLTETLRAEPVLLVAITRPAEQAGSVEVRDRARRTLGQRFVHLALASLPPQDSQQLLKQLLHLGEESGPVIDAILQRAAGNPLYLEEIIRMLLDARVLINEGERWLFSPEAARYIESVPDTIQGLILARFDRLQAAQRRFLQVAAVIGRSFDARILAAVLDVSDAGLEQTLRALIEREFVLPHPEGIGGQYLFTHALVCDAIYSTLLKSERADLHTQVGESLERIYPDRIEEHIELLARHFAWGTRSEKALHYLILAGQKAARGFANQQARQHFEAAMDLLRTVPHSPEQALSVEIGLGDMLVIAGEYQAARAHFQSALQLCATQPAGLANTGRRAGLLRKLGTTYERQGDYDQAVNCLEEAQLILQEANGSLPVELAWVLNDLGWIDSRRGNLPSAEAILLRALSLVENSGQYDVIASIYNRLGGINFQQDQLDAAATYVRKSLVLRQEIGDIQTVARSYNNLGLLNWRKGDWDTALENFRRCMELQANLGDVDSTIALHSNLALLQLDRGDFADAATHLDQASELAQQVGHAYYLGLTYLYRSRLAVVQEDWSRAMEAARRSKTIFAEIGVNDYLVDLACNQGWAWLGQGDLAEAAACAREALGFSTRELSASGASRDQREDRGRALRLMAQIALQRGDCAAALQSAEQSQAIFSGLGNQLELGRTAALTAAIHAEANDLPAARQALIAARLVFRQLGAQVDLRRVEALGARLNRRAPVG